MNRNVPPHWNMMELREVAEVVTGSTPSTVRDDFSGGEIPFVTPTELKGGIPVTKTPVTLTELGAKQVRVIPENSVMVCCIGSLGKIGIAGTRLATNQQINSLVFDEKIVCPRYGFHYCQTLKPLLIHLAPSTTVPIINKGRFQELKIPLPPLPEQKRIAAILDKADAIRRKRQQAVKLTEELLLSVFLDIFGDPVTNPRGWEVKPLAEEITFMTSGSRGWAEHYSDHGSKFIRIQNVKNGQLHFNDIQYVKAPDNKEAARTKVQENDLLISITADLGRTAVVDKQTADEGAHINQHLALVRLSNAINPHFVAAYLESQGGKRQFLQLDQSAVKSGLNFDSIKSLQLYNPPLVLQNQYAAAVKSVENTKVKLKEAADTSDTLFTSLLQRAFRGEL